MWAQAPAARLARSTYWKVVETGAVVAKEQQDVVEGLVMSRLTENRARRGPEPSHWQGVPQTGRV